MKKRSMGDCIRRGCGLVLSLLLLLVPLSTGWAQEQTAQTLILIDDGTIAQGVTIVSLDASKLNAEQARQLLSQQSGAMFDEAALVLTLSERTIEVPLSSLSVTARLDEAVNRAMLIGRSGGISARLQAVQNAQTNGTTVYIPYTYDESVINSAISAIAANIPRETIAGSFTFDPSLPERFVIVEGCKGFTPDEAGLLANVKAALTSGEIGNVTVPGTPAADNGEQVLKEGTAENTVLVGYFYTIVEGSSSRVHNVKTGSSIINGKIVQPGETFSVNDTLGPRNKEAGIWREAGAVLDGRHVSEYGGGLCQVSTTLFNAVIRADLEIVEWVHHTIPSTYVTIGCDATVSTGGPDFKFKNNTDWPVYIVYYYESATKKLTCEIWGRPLPEGQYIELEGKRVGTKGMPATIYTEDPEELREGRAGRYSETYKVWYALNDTETKKDDEVIKSELVDEHLYPALAPIVMKVDPTPAPTDSPTPTP